MAKALLSGAGILSLAFIFAEIATLGRTVIFAQNLIPAQMGAVVMMLASLRLVEMLTDASIERLMLQAPDGSSKSFQNHAHGAIFLRGLLGAGFLLIFSLPLANYFQLPIFGIILLAMVPIVRGGMHLDSRILARHLRQGQQALIDISGSLAGLLAAYPALWLTNGPEAIAWSSLAQVLVSWALSHGLATRKYRLDISKQALLRFWKFGWPLAANALLLYAVFQGERIIVGASFGLDILGRFGIAAQLALIPALLVGRVALSVILPVASRQGQTRQGRFAMHLLGMSAIGGLTFTLAFAFLAPILIEKILGAQYHLPVMIIALMGLAAGFRIMRVAPVILLLARGESRGVLSGSLPRAILFAVGCLLALTGFSLEAFMLAAVAGEALGLLATLLRLRQKILQKTLKEQMA